VAPGIQEKLNARNLGFRALTQRNILTDIKDEGVASIFPAAAPAWADRRDAQKGLDSMTDAQMAGRLSPYSVNWLLLSPETRTQFPCPYRNSTVVICRMSQ
jgi:outer membrane scaffolding protein for murein synthesis (MipA/OmpV family)